MQTKEELQEMYRKMAEWGAFVRRHNANIFDVMFKDVDHSLSERDLPQMISDVALFYNLELPIVKTHCDTLAKMVIDNDGSNNSELYYNWEMLKKTGINNRDAFTLCMVHELAHLYLKGRRFMLCRNERWCHELAADYLVGIYSCLNNLATGKYKYVVGRMERTLTHPHGTHRAEAVEYARNIGFKLPGRDIEALMLGLPAFIYGRSKLLNEELSQCIADWGTPKKEEPIYRMPDNIEDWPDDNLVKQYVMKYRKQDKE